MKTKSETLPITYLPASKERWADIETLFGPRGACGGCWCMTWRLARSEFEKNKYEGNKKALKKIVASEAPVGIIAYHEGKPVAWCAVAPREDYPALERSRVLKPIDDNPVWSISCFFVEKTHRKKGITVGLLRAAVEYAKERGAQIVEGYPVVTKEGTELPASFVWTGLPNSFLKAGFEEAARFSPVRPIMRYYVKRKKK